MSQELRPARAEGPRPLDAPLLAELPTFELFFKTFGFKRLHGRVWGLLVLTGQPLASKEISDQLGISQGATSTALNELAEWGAISSEFDSSRRCSLHSAVGNALSIVATVFRRREQVVLEQFKQTSTRSLEYVTDRYGPRDPRVFTLRSIITTCEIADALMKLVLSSVNSALGDPQSILSRAVNAALKVGVGIPARLFLPQEYERSARSRVVPEDEPRAETAGVAARGQSEEEGEPIDG
jgi:DNA-binding MarR family transcriptional regulator